MGRLALGFPETPGSAAAVGNAVMHANIADVRVVGRGSAFRSFGQRAQSGARILVAAKDKVERVSVAVDLGVVGQFVFPHDLVRTTPAKEVALDISAARVIADRALPRVAQ
ncbi:MAG: hypothetical protein ACRD59_05340 [Candidatus Acidiferrales bacterium]